MRFMILSNDGTKITINTTVDFSHAKIWAWAIYTVTGNHVLLTDTWDIIPDIVY